MQEDFQQLDTHFIKNSDFKTVYGSGVYGGFTPAGQLNMVVYTERVPIPKRISLKVNINSHKVDGEVEKDVKTGLIREVQFGVLFDVNTAKLVLDWLKTQLDEYQRADLDTK